MNTKKTEEEEAVLLNNCSEEQLFENKYFVENLTFLS